MAVIKAINSKSSVGSLINYVADKDKTSEVLMYGKDCSSNPNQAIDDMKMTKELYNKENGRQYKHFVQSFDPKDNITPEKANLIGREWAEKNFKGYEVFIATHKDKDHIHNHFVVNSVNFEDGRKLVYDNKQLAEFKKVNDLLCEREGLHITEPKKDVLTSFNTQKYKALEKGAEGTYKSYLLDLWKNINSSMKKAISKEQFIQSMKDKGYEVNWSDTRKNITFVTPEGKKVRNSNLEKTFKNEKFSKEGLLNEFRRNGERLRERGGTITTGEHISTINRQSYEWEQGRGETTNTVGINTPTNKLTRDDVERAILFGQGTNKIYGVGNDKFVESVKTINEEFGRGKQGLSKETSGIQGAEVGRREETKRIDQGIETGNQGNEGHKLQETRGNIENSIGATGKATSEPFANNENIKFNDFSSGENREIDLEGQSETIPSGARGNNGSHIDDSRSLSDDSSLDEIVNRFKREDKKPVAELEEKQIEKENVKLEQKQIFRPKSKDIDFEI